MDSEVKQIRWPKEWLAVIDKERGSQGFAEFVRDCVAARIGRKKLPPSRGRGRPPKAVK